MTLDEALAQLERRGQQQVRRLNVRDGAGANQFGVKLGDIRAIAKTIKSDHELGSELWRTGNLDAMLLATLILKPSLLQPEELEAMVSRVEVMQLADWLTSYVVKQHPAKEALRVQWMEAGDPMLARAGWSLTAERVAKNPEGLDFDALLDRLDREMGGAPPPTRWTMNCCLAEIGIRSAAHRERAIAIGERLGLYRDYPTSRGCVSPYAPIWIREMVSRRG
ncbi:MAG: DNA alkylation repair protein [Chthonomonadales bacterium]|nr:DNA alkylation repair protein [Chthonomonadales bacterium]